MLCIVSTTDTIQHINTIVSKLCDKFPTISTVILNVNAQNTNAILGSRNVVLYGSGVINDFLCDVPLRLSPHSFSQVNTAAAERLLQVARHYADIQAHETLLDLYCGAGVIGLAMARHCKSLVGVEIIPAAVQAARQSALQMELKNTRFILSDAGKAAIQLEKEGLRPDVVILDPPRKGCDEATLQALVRMSPSRIVMVSCNPSTMARDLTKIVQSGYYVKSVQPVDMFPRTNHVECACLLTKSD